MTDYLTSRPYKQKEVDVDYVCTDCCSAFVYSASMCIDTTAFNDSPVHCNEDPVCSAHREDVLKVPAQSMHSTIAVA